MGVARSSAQLASWLGPEGLWGYFAYPCDLSQATFRSPLIQSSASALLIRPRMTLISDPGMLASICQSVSVVRLVWNVTRGDFFIPAI
jgi:hypothetical protein